MATQKIACGQGIFSIPAPFQENEAVQDAKRYYMN
jgi:hypothetical protein